jgi:hypothetical protein
MRLVLGGRQVSGRRGWDAFTAALPGALVLLAAVFFAVGGVAITLSGVPALPVASFSAASVTAIAFLVLGGHEQLFTALQKATSGPVLTVRVLPSGTGLMK